MEIDIVTKLREWHMRHVLQALHHEAADEITRLRVERDTLVAKLRDAEHDREEFRRTTQILGSRLTELEQQEPIAWLQDVNRHNGQPPHYEHVADSHGGQDGTFQAFRRPVPATPADYTLPAGSMGAKKLEQIGGWEHWKPMGLVLHNNVESVAITEHGRVTWGDAPERPNSRLLAAARAVVARWETPLWKDAPATAGFIYELRDAAMAAAEFDSNSAQTMEDPAPSTGRTYSTKEAAAVLNIRPNTLNVALCTHGTYFGVTPKKKKNGRLVWNAEQIDAMAAGEVFPREVAE